VAISPHSCLLRPPNVECRGAYLDSPDHRVRDSLGIRLTRLVL